MEFCINRDTEPSTEKKMMDFHFTVRNISGAYQTKYCYGSVKKSKCSFNCHLQIDKKINNVNKKELIQTLIFPKLPSSYEVLIRRNVK